MKIEKNGPQVFTFARPVAVRLMARAPYIGLSLSPEARNLNVSNVVGECIENDADMARIAVTEIAYDKNNPCFYRLDASLGGPINITVRMSNIIGCQAMAKGR